jgi:2-oxoglutarate dehydrogenase E2 component (dihydrolipoamide succinyltransferase)
MIEVRMPQLGESVAEGTVTKWLVREGDHVSREQSIVEVATDKADTEIPAPAGGRITQIAVTEGTVVAKGGLLCCIDDAAGAQPAATPAEPPAEPSAPSLEASEPAAPAAPAAPLGSPSTRKLALQTGVDLNQVQGSGDRGRITREDVLRAASRPDVAAPAPPPAGLPAQPAPAAAAPSPPIASPAAAELSQMIQAGGGFVPPIPGAGYGSYRVPAYAPKPGDQVVPFTRRRRITADHMVYSKFASPHVVTVAEIDLAATSRLREEHKAAYKKEGTSLTFLAFVCAATIRALREHPAMNARVLEGSYVLLKEIHLGIAVDTPGGLIVPSIKQADQLSLRGIARSVDELAARARAGKTTADDLSGTTFTVSNPGLKGNLFGAAIISQPNVGILRMGEIKKRPVVVTRDGDDSIAIHPVMYAALSYDHRIVDGVLANSFLWRIADILIRGEFEL